jgi:hypothetical protein
MKCDHLIVIPNGAIFHWELQARTRQKLIFLAKTMNSIEKSNMIKARLTILILIGWIGIKEPRRLWKECCCRNNT